MEENIIPAINGYIINEKKELLILKEKGNDTWLALSGVIKDGDEEKTLTDKAEKELSLTIKNPIFFDSGLVGNIEMHRYLITEYEGKIDLKNKYEDYKWIDLEKLQSLEEACPHVKKVAKKIIKIMSELKKGIYKHYKGKEYRLLAEAKNSETKEIEVVYQDLEDNSKIWVRPKAMFLEEVGDDKKVKRFEFLKEEDNDWEYKYKLAVADYQNVLKKTAAEKTDFAKYAISDLLEDIIPIYDHLKMSLCNLPAEEEGNAWVQGVKYVLKQFKEVLESRGVEEIKTVGEKFDHHTMEALEGEGDKVIKEVMPGYKLNGRLIKAAKVIVSNS